MVCTVAVQGLNNFAVGMPSVWPTAGRTVDRNSYTRCGTINTVVRAGKVVTVNCSPSTENFRYVIVQSLTHHAHRLCIAEVTVYGTSKYATCLHWCSNKTSPGLVAIRTYIEGEYLTNRPIKLPTRLNITTPYVYCNIARHRRRCNCSITTYRRCRKKH